MARSIATRRIAQRAAPTRKIATQSAASGSTVAAYLTNYGPGSPVWTVPATGGYRITQWGSGGGPNGSGTGGSGGAALAQVVRFLKSGQTVTFSIAPSAANDADGASTTATLPDGSVITAGGGSSGTNGGAGGTATGGDTNVSGSAHVGGTGGTAASLGTYLGGTGGLSPGGGNDGGSGTNRGGAGMVLIVRES